MFGGKLYHKAKKSRQRALKVAKTEYFYITPPLALFTPVRFALPLPSSLEPQHPTPERHETTGKERV